MSGHSICPWRIGWVVREPAAARLMLVEPAGHVGSRLLEARLAAARTACWAMRETPSIKGCIAAVFELERRIV